jgi:hypothetical protein
MLLEAVWILGTEGDLSWLWIHVEAVYVVGSCVAEDGGCGFM